jgi:steroid delta-isomerase-like uncharacterized protein
MRKPFVIGVVPLNRSSQTDLPEPHEGGAMRHRPAHLVGRLPVDFTAAGVACLVLVATSGGSPGRRGRLSRKGFVGAGVAAAAGLVGAPNALGEKREPTNSRKRAALRAKRERIVGKHFRTENVQKFDETLDTFAHPRYEIIPTGDVVDGRRNVGQYYEQLRTAFPDQRATNVVLRHADAAVITEFHLLGTMNGPLQGIPATGKSFKVRVTGFFLFEPGGTKIVCERTYFDLYALLQQTGILEVVASAGLELPASGGVPIDRKEPGVKPIKT